MATNNVNPEVNEEEVVVDTTATVEEATDTVKEKVEAAKEATKAARAAKKTATKARNEATAEVVKETVKKARATSKKNSDKLQEFIEDAKETAEVVIAKVQSDENVKKATASAKKTAEKVSAAAKDAVEEIQKETKKRSTRKPAKNVVLQYAGKEIDLNDIEERAIAQYNTYEEATTVKTINIYLKPEDNAAYFVINDSFRGRVDF